MFTCRTMHQSILKINTHNSFVLQNVSDAGARKLKAEVDPEGPDHNECSGYPQHSPWRHLIHKLCYFKHLNNRKKWTVVELKTGYYY